MVPQQFAPRRKSNLNLCPSSALPVSSWTMTTLSLVSCHQSSVFLTIARKKPFSNLVVLLHNALDMLIINSLMTSLENAMRTEQSTQISNRVARSSLRRTKTQKAYSKMVQTIHQCPILATMMVVNSIFKLHASLEKDNYHLHKKENSVSSQMFSKGKYLVSWLCALVFGFTCSQSFTWTTSSKSSSTKTSTLT